MKSAKTTTVIIPLIAMLAQSSPAAITVTGLSAAYSHRVNTSGGGADIEAFEPYSNSGTSTNIQRYAEYPDYYPEELRSFARSNFEARVSPDNRLITLSCFANVKQVATLGYILNVYFETGSESSIMYGHESIQEYTNPTNNENGRGLGLTFDIVKLSGGTTNNSPVGAPVFGGPGGPIFGYELEPNAYYRIYSVITNILPPPVIDSISGGAMFSFGSIPTNDDFDNFDPFRAASVPEPSSAFLLTLGATLFLRRRSLRTHERNG